MAIFHFAAQVISRSDAGNAVAAAAYRAGMRLTCERTGQTFNHTRKREVTHRAILAPEGAPSWVAQRHQLWNQVEAVETRVNSQLAREVEVSLPIELPHHQQVELLHAYVQAQFVSQGMVADIALHAKVGNPHAHILLTLRDIGPQGFGAKRRDWNDKALINQWRAAWAQACNQALEDNGHVQRVDHRSHRARGMDVPATVHLGRKTSWNAESWNTRADFNAWVQTCLELAKVQGEVQRVQTHIIDLTTTLSEALAQREAQSSRAVSPPATTTQTAPATRTWLSTSEMPGQDFSIQGRQRQRTGSAPVLIHPDTSQPQPPELLHGPDGFTHQGDKPC